MPAITVIEFNGTQHTIEAEIGTTLMENVLDNNIPGIDADCGGACACGTCHCFVAAGWQELAGAPQALEESMLSMRPDREEASRLSCQIRVTDAMDGLAIRLPEYQM